MKEVFSGFPKASLYIKKYKTLIDLAAILVVVVLVISYIRDKRAEEQLEQEAQAEKWLVKQNLINKKKKQQEEQEVRQEIKSCVQRFLGYTGPMLEELRKKSPKQLEEHWVEVCTSRSNYRKSLHNNSSIQDQSFSGTYSECIFSLSNKYTDNYTTTLEAEDISIRIRRECAHLK
jgi:transcriptional regulator of heat shock response